MKLALRPSVIAGVAVIGAGLIHVTPVAAPISVERAVELAAVTDSIDLVGPVDGLASELPNPADWNLPTYLDSVFWQEWWDELTAGNYVATWWMLINAGAELPIIGPVFSVIGLTSFFGPIVLASLWHQIEVLFGFDANPAVADAMGPLGDSAALVLDPGVVTSILEPGAMGELGAVFDPAGVADIATLPSPELEDVLTSLMP